MSYYTLRPKQIQRFWSRVDKSAGDDSCWLWIYYRDRNGYGMANFNRVNYISHRLAWQLTYGDIPDGLLVCHRCDNPPCCNPKHLFLGTQKDNMQDMSKKGRNADKRGEKSPVAKLTQKQVDEIRERFATGGVTKAQLSREYSVGQTTIHYVITFKRWKN